MKRTNLKVDAYISEDRKWRKESERLRMISLGCGLTEELKWGKPCYTFQESNVVIIQGFKEYCALMFCKGALLRDTKGVLKRIGEHTQAARQARFTSVREIVEMEPTLKAYIYEAVEAEKAGLKVILNKYPCLENCFLCADARAAKRIHLLFFCGQTIQDPGVED